jgi:hypothetical protein
MRYHGSALLVLLFSIALILPPTTAGAVKPTKIKEITVNCNVPGQTITAALDSTTSDTDDVIFIEGTCIEDVEIGVHRVTLQAGTDPGAIDGEVFINGVQNVTISELVISNGDFGILGLDNADVFVKDVTIQNTNDTGVQASRSSSIVLDNVAVTGAAGVGVSSFSGSFIDIRNGSTIENNTSVGLSVTIGSSARVRNSTVQNNGETQIFVGIGGVARIQDSQAISANQQRAVGVAEGGVVRVQDSTLTSNIGSGNATMNLGSNATVTLRGVNSISNTGGAFSVSLVGGGNVFRQSNGHSVINGPIEVFLGGVVRLFDAEVVGDISVDLDSILDLRDLSGDLSNKTVTGNITVRRDSAVHFSNFGGGALVQVDGDVTCVDDESSIDTAANATISGTFNCTGFD